MREKKKRCTVCAGRKEEDEEMETKSGSKYEIDKSREMVRRIVLVFKEIKGRTIKRKAKMEMERGE